MARELINTIKDERENYLINGAMEISQRGSSFAAVANGTYTLDRYIYNKSGAMVHTVSQNNDVPTLAQAGYVFNNSLRLNLTTPDTAIAATDFCIITQHIEGNNYVKFAEKAVTLSFWVKSSLAGTYCVAFRNQGLDRSFITEYTINSVNTWEKKTVTMPALAVSGGTWNYSTGTGIQISWTLAAGTILQAPAGSWQSGNFIATANQVNAVNTGVTDFRITGVCLNEGSTARSFVLFGKDFSGEVEACQRYYEKSYNLQAAPGTVTATGSMINTKAVGMNGGGSAYFITRKRGNPAISLYSPVTGTLGQIRDISTGVDRVGTAGSISETKIGDVGSTATPNGNANSVHWAADAELT